MDDTMGVEAEISVAVNSMRARCATAFDDARRNVPASADGMERELLKDPFLLDALGLEPLDGDPTIEQIERELAGGEGDDAAE